VAKRKRNCRSVDGDKKSTTTEQNPTVNTTSIEEAMIEGENYDSTS